MSNFTSLNFPNVDTPIINPQTGTIDPVWYMFFMRIFRTIGGSNPTDFSGDDALINTSRAPNIQAVAQVISEFRNYVDTGKAPNTDIANLRSALAELQSYVVNTRSLNIQPLINRLTELEANFASHTHPKPVQVQQIGEFVTATVAAGSAVALTNNVTSNITSISLTAGDWDVAGAVDFSLNAATTSLFQSGPSPTSATLPTQAGGSGLGTDALALLPLALTASSATLNQHGFAVRLKITQTTTLYLTAQASFSAGSVSAYGTLRARRDALTT